MVMRNRVVEVRVKEMSEMFRKFADAVLQLNNDSALLNEEDKEEVVDMLSQLCLETAEKLSVLLLQKNEKYRQKLLKRLELLAPSKLSKTKIDEKTAKKITRGLQHVAKIAHAIDPTDFPFFIKMDSKFDTAYNELKNVDFSYRDCLVTFDCADLLDNCDLCQKIEQINDNFDIANSLRKIESIINSLILKVQGQGQGKGV